MPFIQWINIKEKEPVAGFHGRFIHTDNMTISYWNINANSALPPHTHPHEQITNVIEGVFEITVAGETRHLDSGTVAVIPSNVPHSGKALTDCKIIDVFYPLREDYR
jgi:quercetin dioxygenase-like cupin family protein